MYRSIARLTLLITILSPSMSHAQERKPVVLTDEVLTLVRQRIAQPGIAEKWRLYVAGKPHTDIASWDPYQYQDLLDCALIARIDGNAKFLKLAECFLDIACSRDDWSAPDERIQLVPMAVNAEAVALAYNWLYPDLSARQRQRVEQALERVAFLPYLAAAKAKAYPCGRPDDRWCAIGDGAVGVAAAIAKDRCASAPAVLSLANSEVTAMLDQIGEGHLWKDGAAYYEGVMEHILLFAQVQQQLGLGVSVCDNPGWKEAASLPLALRASGEPYTSLLYPAARVPPPRSVICRLAVILDDPHLQALASELPVRVGRWPDVIWGLASHPNGAGR